jgi:hypothetical protein
VIIGVTPGGSAPLAQVDYVTDPSITITGLGSILEQFSASNPFNLDGSFILFVPNASGGYDVQLVNPAPPPVVAAVATHRASATAASASAGFTLQGRAYDAQGNPVAGAKVTITSSLALSYKGVATTDATGAYTLADVPYGGIGVTASIGGTLTLGGAVVRSGSGYTIDLRPFSPITKTPPQPAAVQSGQSGASTALRH